MTTTYEGKVVFKGCKPGTLELFGESLLCTSQNKMRLAIKKAGGTVSEYPVTIENSKKLVDNYDSSQLLMGSKELIVSYSSDDQSFVEAKYVFPRPLNSEQFTSVKDMIVSKYGKPNSESNELSKTAHWNLDDFFLLQCAKVFSSTRFI